MSSYSRYKTQQNRNMAIAVVTVIAVIFGVVSILRFGKDASCDNRENDPKRDGYCTVEQDDFDELVIVTGNTQNSPAPELDFEKDKDLRNILSGVFYSSNIDTRTPDIHIVSAAGDNHTIDFDNDYKVAQSVTASKNKLQGLGDEINDAIKSLPSEGGADYLGAILEANNLISTDARNPLIIVVGSGYSDNGILNFATNDIINMYKANSNSVIDMLSRNSRTREGVLNGVTMQKSLKQHETDVEDIYTTVLSYLGAKIKHSNFRSTGVGDDTKSVDSSYAVMPVFVDELEGGEFIDFTESMGRFYPDEARLIDPVAVEEKLASFAKRFNPENNLKLVVTGYIAFCIDEGQLGTARANTVKDILTKLGIPADRIETHGEPGSPPEKEGEAYTCDSSLPETERRTIQIKVVKMAE